MKAKEREVKIKRALNRLVAKWREKFSGGLQGKQRGKQAEEASSSQTKEPTVNFCVAWMGRLLLYHLGETMLRNRSTLVQKHCLRKPGGIMCQSEEAGLQRPVHFFLYSLLSQ
jgi:hypothetical protein